MINSQIKMYLYSKNKIFKYIYDQFSDKDATSMESLLDDSSMESDKYKIGTLVDKKKWGKKR